MKIEFVHSSKKLPLEVTSKYVALNFCLDLWIISSVCLNGFSDQFCKVHKKVLVINLCLNSMFTKGWSFWQVFLKFYNYYYYCHFLFQTFYSFSRHLLLKTSMLLLLKYLLKSLHVVVFDLKFNISYCSIQKSVSK